MNWHSANRRRARKLREPPLEQIRRFMNQAWNNLIANGRPLTFVGFDLANGADCYVEAIFQRQPDGSLAIVAVDQSPTLQSELKS